VAEPIKQYIAAKAIIRRDGRVLVLQQSHEAAVTGAGKYHPPGGIVEPGETLREAVVREVEEECQMEVTPGEVVGVEEWEANIRGEHCMFVGIYIACELKGDADVRLQEAEVVNAEWVGPDDLDRVDILPPSLNVIRRVLGQH
jgi:8-oxo-dGTP diphosphatase